MAVAEIALDITLNVESQHRNMEIAVSKRRKYMVMSVEKSTSPLPEYEGPYETESKLYYARTLETAGKRMAQDVVVNPIKVTETHNPQGGKSIVIG